MTSSEDAPTAGTCQRWLDSVPNGRFPARDRSGTRLAPPEAVRSPDLSTSPFASTHLLPAPLPFTTAVRSFRPRPRPVPELPTTGTDGDAHGSTEDPEQARAARQARKLEKRSDTRPLDPWERYRALTDLQDTYFDTTELLDRKTRFALLIMGGCNAVNVLIAARPGPLQGVLTPAGAWVQAYVAVYAMLALYLFVQAINALKPRVALLASAGQPATADLRFADRAAAMDTEAFYEMWNAASVGDVSRSLALQAQMTARELALKHAALDAVYRGLVVLTCLTGGLVAVTMLAHLI